jgi:acetyl-CoA acetyltransferase
MEPTEVNARKAKETMEVNEYPWAQTTLEHLFIEPSSGFRKESTVTTGNALRIADGAAAIITASEDAA